MSKLFKQLMAVMLAFQMSLTSLPAVHAEEPEDIPEIPTEQLEEETVTEETEEAEEITEETGEPEETEAPAEQVTAEEPEEAVLPEEPEETVLPEPEETVTPEEPAETEEPEETVIPEEPEETEVPEEPEDPTEITPAEEAEEIELDGSELFQLDITPKEYTSDVIINSVSYEDGMADGSFLVKFQPAQDEDTYIVASKGETRWFLGRYDDGMSGLQDMEISCPLPAGAYQLHAAYFQNGDLYESWSYYNLVVLDAPVLTGAGDFTGSEYGYIDVDLDPIVSKGYEIAGLGKDKIELIVKEKAADNKTITLQEAVNYAEDGVFRIALGDPDAYGGTGNFKETPYGSFDISWHINGADSVQGNYVFVSSDKAYVDVMSAYRPSSMYISVKGPFWLMYKGATGQLEAQFGPRKDDDTEYEGVDRRVKWTSSNPSVLKVDQNGTLTVVKATSDLVNVNITATSVAYPEIAPAVYTATVGALAAGRADMKAIVNGTEYTKLNWTLKQQSESNHLATVVFHLDVPEEFPPGMPVTFTVDGDGLDFLTNPSNPDASPVAKTYMSGLGMDGNAYAMVRGWEPGSYTVKVSTPIGKTGSLTINVNGISHSLAGAATKNSQYFVDGKAVSGWLRYDNIPGTYVYGKDVFKGFTDPYNQFIYYADPKTKKLMTGDPMSGADCTVAKIDGKLYAFENGVLIVPTTEDHILVDKGWIAINHETAGLYDAYAARTGELLTGWQNDDGEWYYFDPVMGNLSFNKYVPAQNGKGYVYVNANGEARGTYIGASGETYTNQPFTAANGLYKVNTKNTGEQRFWVKNGAFYTGWLYLHYDANGSPNWNTTKKGAVEKMYFDPNKNGALQAGTFSVGTKHYCSQETYEPVYWGEEYMSVWLLNCLCFGNGKYPEKYAINPDTGFVVDADGAIVYNKLVKIAAWDGMAQKYETHYVYADNYGNPVMDDWATVGGKKYYFDSQGYLAAPDLTLSDWSYLDESSNFQPVYFKTKNAKKPTDGYVYYTADSTKLTSIAIYEDGSLAFMLDAKGNVITNKVATVRFGMAPADGTATYIADAEGNIYTCDHPGYRIVDLGKKSYIVDAQGIVQKNSTAPVYAVNKESMYDVSTGYVMADKNGVLYKNTFREVTTAEDGTFKVYITETGFISNAWNNIYTHGIDYYALYAKKKTWLEIETSREYLGIVIPGKTIIPETPGAVFQTGRIGGTDSPIYLNKDGSIKSGFIKTPEGTRYIFTMSNGLVEAIAGGAHYYSGKYCNELIKLGSKTYFFDTEGLMVTGWVHFEHTMLCSADMYMAGPAAIMDTTLLDDAYMYFDPKTGAAVTKSAKVPVPAVYDGEISLGEEGTFLNNAKRVNTTSVLKTLYFTADGALIRDQNTKIGKKLSEVGADGVVTTGTPHWSDAYKTTYVMKNGALATGRKKIDGQYYYFDPTTGVKVTNALRKTGKKWYYYGEYGIQETPVLSMDPFAVTLPLDLRDAFGNTAYVRTGSMTGKDLTALWNKDGSLKKIVYTGTTKAAAGESVSFGLWSDDSSIMDEYIQAGLNGYVLDSKGLPKTGIVTGMTTGTGTYTQNVAKDGKKVVESDMVSLVKVGKKYYLMNGGIVLSGDPIYALEDWSTLSASEQKSLNEMAKVASAMKTGLYVMVNPDGSVAANTKKYGAVYDLPSGSIYGTATDGIWTTNKQGIILDLVAPMFKVGKTAYLSNTSKYQYAGKGAVQTMMMSPGGMTYAEIRYDGNKILGFYDTQTGKAMTGLFGLPITGSGMYIFLKNGKPQSGNQKYTAEGYTYQFWIDANMIGTVVLY